MKPAKLAILDKDGTLTGPASGATFPQHPQDQILLPGVENAVARLVADGYTIVIASNQGGCDVQTIPAYALKSGQYWHDAPNGGLWKIKRVSDRGDSLTIYGECTDSLGGDWNITLPKEANIQVSWKTIEDTIAEMRYCMGLLPAIKTALFCPDFAGEQCFEVSKNAVFEAHGRGVCYEKKLHGLFRKPHPGMLKLAIASFGGMIDLACPDAKDNFLMIGDSADDSGASLAAGIPFLDAAKWRKGRKGAKPV